MHLHFVLAYLLACFSSGPLALHVLQELEINQSLKEIALEATVFVLSFVFVLYINQICLQNIMINSHFLRV